MSLAVDEDRLYCSTDLNPPQPPAETPVKQAGVWSRLSGNFKISMKSFRIPGTPSLSSGVTTGSPAHSKTALAKGLNTAGVSAYLEEEMTSGGSAARSMIYVG